MKDLRVFVSDNYLYLYDRGLLRLNQKTNIVRVEYVGNGTYSIKNKDLATKESSTGKVEEMVESILNNVSCSDMVNRLEAENKVSSIMGISKDTAKKSLDLLNKKTEDNVTRLMREIALLSHKEKAELLMQIIDLF